MSKYGRYLIFLIFLSVCCCGVGVADSVAWVRESDSSLWLSSLFPQVKPTLLYGHNVGDAYLVPSPDGRFVAAKIIPDGVGIGLFDALHPGTRRTIPLGENEWFVGEWSHGGRGVLVSRFSTEDDMDGVHKGVYELDVDQSRRLVVPPAVNNRATFGYSARYSPDGSLVAVHDGWLQIARVVPKVETLVFRSDLASDPGASMTWTDNNHLVTGRLTAPALRGRRQTKRNVLACAQRRLRNGLLEVSWQAVRMYQGLIGWR